MSFQIVSRSSKQGSSSRSNVEEPYRTDLGKDEKDDFGGQEKKKKRKKKVGSKEERKLKREAEKLKQIYAPKDSHIQMITPEVLQKLRGESSTKSQRTPSLFSSQDSQRFPVICPSIPIRSHLQSPVGIGNKESPDSTSDFPVLRKSAPPAPEKNPFNVSIHRVKAKDAKQLKNFEPLWEIGPAVDKPNAWEDYNEFAEENVACQKVTEQLPEIPTVSKRKPSKKPMIISINELIEAKKEAKTLAKTVERKRKDSNEKFTTGNLLDSSGPVVMNRGKIREKPKPKRSSPLKRAIMKTRALRKANITTNFARNINSTITVVKTEVETECPTSCNALSLELESITSQDENSSIENSCIKSEDENNAQYFSSRNYDEHHKDMNIINEDKNLSFKFSPHRGNENEKQPIKTEKSEEDIFSDKIKEIMKSAEESAISSKDVEISEECRLKIKSEMHSKKFRPYCDMYTSKDLHGKIWELLKELHRFQDRLYHSDPLKYKIKKRYIHGLKDVHANLSVNKLQLIIIAPDIEPNNEKGGLDEKLETIISLARDKNVPYIFSGNRYILGKPIRIKTPVSAIGILDYQAAEELSKTIMDEASKLREEYESDFSDRLSKLKL